jgi:hypothetical protein
VGTSFTATAGAHTYVVKQTDLAGNASVTSTAVMYTLETATVTAIMDNVGSVTGTVANGATTDDTSLSVSGTLSVALTGADKVNIYDGGTLLGTATVSGTTWTYADTRTLSHAQVVSYTARVADAAGNVGAESAAYTATVDTVAPDAPSVIGGSTGVLAGIITAAVVDGSNGIGIVISGEVDMHAVVTFSSNPTFIYDVYYNNDTNSIFLYVPKATIFGFGVGEETMSFYLVDAAGNKSQTSTKIFTVEAMTPPLAIDLNGDGRLDSTAWVGRQDGVLVWDKYQDGHVHDNSQYAFAQYANNANANGAGATDLSGLADAFDSNHDGKFNAQDAKFAQFKVWQDVNQNGVSEATEVRSLADWGLTEINLSSDGVQRTPAAGVTEAGRTTASATDGMQVLVSDAAFAYNSLAYSVSEGSGDAGVKLNLLGSEMSLDLSSFTARYGHVGQVDVSGTGANTLKINLSDVLQGAQTGTLQVTGNADDTVLLDANVWTNTGSVVQGDGHTYALYSAANGLAAQLLLDQQMVQHVA